MKAHGDRVPIWNVWWTLTMISAAFTIVVILLEYFGVFRDFKIVLGALGVIATIVFGVSASTRSSVRALDDRLEGIDHRLGGIDARLGGIDVRLMGIEQLLGGFVGGQRVTNEALIRIEELLRTRLPAA
ncbi:MAG TPA: hypothetical protein VID04_02600 [Methylomirabilota bacterium]|jgi:hypothetical protein